MSMRRWGTSRQKRNILEGELMNPLAQRLFLYRFAYVQVDPRLPLGDRQLWVKGLQGRIPRKSVAGWRHWFRELQPFSQFNDGSVMSPSLRLLRQIRARQPLRPLILIQTAFETPFAVARLKDLQHMAFPRLRLMVDDGLTPLYWLGSRFQEKVGQPFQSYLNYFHPRRDWLVARQKAHPERRIWPREDGAILGQYCLWSGGRYNAGRKTDDVGACWGWFDQAWKAEIGGLKGHWWVHAKQPQRLRWFRRDFVRLSQQRSRLGWGPSGRSEVSDRFATFHLVADKELRFTSLKTANHLHLDGTRQDRRYRSCRIGRPGYGRWYGLEGAPVGEFISLCGRRLCVLKTELGWRSYDGPCRLQTGNSDFWSGQTIRQQFLGN